MRLAYIGIPWRLIIQACRDLPPLQPQHDGERHMTTEKRNVRDDIFEDYQGPDNPTFGDEDPTLRVEVPALPPKSPKSGLAYVALSPRETDINTISAETWELSRIDVFEDETFSYLGQLVVEGIRCNVWWATDGDAFVAQKLAA